jgi:hypothetical protein
LEERNTPNSPYFEGIFFVIAIFRQYYSTWDHYKKKQDSKDLLHDYPTYSQI